MLALMLALGVVLLAAVAAAAGPRALASNTHVILGPPGYDTNGDTLIVAGTTTPTLESGDHVVICHALGMTNKDGYNQIAPSAGVVFGHAGPGHQAGEDIIPPFLYSGQQSTDTTLEHGQNWTAENRLVYENGCVPSEPQTASLTVKKHVVGGTATAGNFTMVVDAAGTSGDVSFAGSESGTTVTVPVGAYTVTESGPSHYTKTSSTNCEGTLAAGESKTCTIENTYTPPEPTKGTVVVEKVTVPAGFDQDFEFTIEPKHDRSLATHTGFTLNAGSVETSTHTLEVDPGWYTITEGDVHGWTLTSVVCTGDDGQQDPGPASIHVRAGETTRCVFTNSTATLTVVKKVVGGTAKPGDFTIDVDAAHDATFPGSAAGTTVVIGAGPYTVGEHGGPANYTMTRSEGCTGTAALGAALTCTITNTYTPPEVPTTPTTTTTPATTTTAPIVSPAVDLTVTKADSPDPVVVGGTLTYTLTVTNTPPKTGQAFTATDVTLVDPLPAGVVLVTVSPSQGTCTFTAGTITCKLGSLAPGQTAAVVVKVRPTSPGRLSNSAVAVAVEPELNSADNAATEMTTVRGPFTPPSLLCTTLRVAPLSLQVGHKRLVVVVVRDQRGKVLAGATVTVKGPGVLVRGKTSQAGVYRRVFHPKKPGVLVVRVLPSASGHCLGRVGVVGVFQPPVTG